MRFDSYAASTWVNGDVLTGAQSNGAVIVVSAALKAGKSYLFAVQGTSDVAVLYTARLRASDDTVRWTQNRAIAAGGNEDFGLLGPLVAVEDGDVFECIVVGTPAPSTGLQLSINTILL